MPSSQILQTVGADDAQCSTAVVSEDERGRAVISEGHTGDFTGAECSITCSHSCGCASTWVIGGTEAGGPLVSANKIRYRQVFSGDGNCFSTLGDVKYTDNANAANHGLASFTIEKVPKGYAPLSATYPDSVTPSAFATSHCGPNSDSHSGTVPLDPNYENWCDGPSALYGTGHSGVCTCANQDNWWKWCGGGDDHTIVYVDEQRRSNYDDPFGVQTVNGVCGYAGSWRYEAMEIYVLSYIHYPALNCYYNNVTNPNITNLDMPLGLSWVTYGAHTLTDTAEECMEACQTLPLSVCGGIVYGYTNPHQYKRCWLRTIATGTDVESVCESQSVRNHDVYVRGVQLGASRPPASPSPPPPPPSSGRRLDEPEALGTSAVIGRRLQEAPSPPSPPHVPQDTGIGDDLLPHGGFEIWYSDVSAFFGTKARTVLTGQQERTSVYAIDRTERGDYARGRYVTLRIYHPHKRLRLETMEVFGDDGTGVGGSGRRLFAETPEAGREPPPNFAPSPTPSPSPSPSPTPSPTPEPDPEAWWLNLEVSRRAGELYARRTLPDAQGHSAAASVAVAITLAHPKFCVMAGQDATLYATCAALGRCETGDYWTSIHDRKDADVDVDSSDPTHLPIDDAGWATLLLSLAVEPAVHAVIEGTLLCLAPALCMSHCDVCSEWVGLGNATAEQVLRRVELALHAAPKQASRSVLDCVGSFDCLGEIATEVALALGADALPPTVRMKTVAQANYALLEGAREEAQQNASWQVRRPARFALLREHAASVQAHAQTPLGEDDEAAEAGRRLGERPPPAPPPLTEMHKLMKVATNATCQQLDDKNATGAHEAHVQATHLWMQMSGGGNDAQGQGRACVDCQFPNYTTSCRQHFAHVGRALIKMRMDAERPPKASYADRKRRMTQHVRSHMDQMCCAIVDGKEVCEARFCVIHVQRTMVKRTTHVARKMTEENHPSAVEHFGVAAQVGMDIVNPDLHHDPACRVSNHSNDVEKMECFGKSILHHLGKEHGLDPDSMQSKLDDMGVNVGEGLIAMAKTFGWVQEGRGPAKSAFFEKQGHAAAAADRLMRESRRRTDAKQPSAGRRLMEDRETWGGHGLGEHAMHAGSMRRHLQNASGVMHRAMMAVDRAATAANNVQSRGTSASGARAPRPDELEWRTATDSMASPLTTLLAVSAEEGSYASRFGGAFVKLNALRDRVSGALDAHRRRLERREEHHSRRRMSDSQQQHANALYEALEAEHMQHEHKRPQLPKEHALSWLHELVDWPSTVDEGSRLLSIVRARHKMREGGAKHHDIVKTHPTGWSMLDDAARSQPTVFGDSVRRLLYRKETGTDPPWHHKSFTHRVSRRLEDADATHEAHAAEVTPPSRFGSVRRLGVAFLESTVAAPFAFYDMLLPSGATVKKSEVTFWEASLRYVISGTVGCYFVAPASDASTTQGADGAEGGDKLKILRPSEEKLCFPALPFALPPLAPFRQATGTEGVDVYTLNYMDYCAGRGSAMQAVADWLVSWGIDPRDENVFLPNAPMLRSAEAVDAILNAATSGAADVNNEVNAGRILCSIVQLGGIIYVSLLIVVALVILQLLPIVNVTAQVLFEGCNVARTGLIAASAAAKVGNELKLDEDGSRISDVLEGAKGEGAVNDAANKATGKAKDAFSKGLSSLTGRSASSASDIDDEYRTPQQMRALMRKRRGESGTCVSSTVSSVASFGRRAMRLGATTERSELLPQV